MTPHADDKQQQGDEEATEVLTKLGEEAKAKRKKAMVQLRALAEQGEPRAIAMLQQLEAAEKGSA